MSIAQVKGFSKASILLFNKKHFLKGNTRVLRYKLASKKAPPPAALFDAPCRSWELGNATAALNIFSLLSEAGVSWQTRQLGFGGLVIHHRRFWKSNKAIVRNHHIREEIHLLKWVIFYDVNLPECSWKSKS